MTHISSLISDSLWSFRSIGKVKNREHFFYVFRLEKHSACRRVEPVRNHLQHPPVQPRTSGKEGLEGFARRFEERGESTKGAAAALRIYGRQNAADLAAFRQVLVKLRQMLALYYAGPGVDDPVIIEMPKGDCRATVRLRQQDAKSAVPPAFENQLQAVDCHYVGNDHRALAYVLEQFKLSLSQMRSPKLISIRDLHVRFAEKRMRYSSQAYEELQQVLGEFLKRSDQSVFAEFIFGRIVDEDYVRVIEASAVGQENKVRCYKLKQSGFVMNYIILDYEDDTSEVLFGWGQRELGSPGAVFRSSDKRMVDEFSAFHDILRHSSTQIPTLLRL